MAGWIFIPLYPTTMFEHLPPGAGGSLGPILWPRAGGHSAFLRFVGFVGRAAKGPPAGQAKGMASLGVTDSGFAPVWPGRPCSSGLPPSGSARKGNHTGRFSDTFMTRKEDWAVQRGHGHPGRGSQGARLPWGASMWRGAQRGAWRRCRKSPRNALPLPSNTSQPERSRKWLSPASGGTALAQQRPRP